MGLNAENAVPNRLFILIINFRALFPKKIPDMPLIGIRDKTFHNEIKNIYT